MFKEYIAKDGSFVSAVEVAKGTVQAVKDAKKNTFEYLEAPYRAVVTGPRKPVAGDFIVQITETVVKEGTEGDDVVSIPVQKTKLVSGEKFSEDYRPKRTMVY